MPINSTGNNVYSENFVHLKGRLALEAKFMDAEFEILPPSFLQVNNEIMNKVYNKVIELAGAKEGKTILDLYSGIGITSLIFARAGAQVVSVEIEKSAVYEARRMIKANKMSGKINALQGDCAMVLSNLSEYVSDPENTTAFIDPPRSGLGKEMSKILNESGVSKIIYLSCNPFTLADDLEILTKNYRVTKVMPYDMFPQTAHIEALVCLIKK